MPNINLTTEDVSRNVSTPAEKGLAFSVAILVFMGVLYGALLGANFFLSSKIKAVQEEYKTEFDNFLSGGGSEVIDFKNRGEVAGKMITENRPPADILGKIENSLLPAVYLNSLKYDRTKQTVTLLCIGDSFQTFAKQVLSFKQDSYFSAVIPGRSFLDAKNNNKLNFYIDLKLK